MVAGTDHRLAPETVNQHPRRIGDRKSHDTSERQSAANLGHRQTKPDTAKDRDDVEQTARADNRIDQSDEAHEDKTDLRPKQPHLGDESRPAAPSASALRVRQAARFTDREPGQHADEKARGGICPERRSESQVVGQQTARKRTDTDREDKHPMIDRHRPPATVGLGDIRQYDLARRQDEAGASAREEAGDDEFRKTGGLPRTRNCRESKQRLLRPAWAGGRAGRRADPTAWRRRIAPNRKRQPPSRSPRRRRRTTWRRAGAPARRRRTRAGSRR